MKHPPKPPAASSAPTINYGQLNARIGYAIRRAQIAIFQDFFRAFAGENIKPAQYSILTIIENNPGLTQSHVAMSLGIKKTNFVAMIDALEKRGLVERQTVPQDRRSYALFLTATGRALMPQLHHLAEQHELRIIALTGRENYERLVEPVRAIGRLVRSSD